MFHPSSPNLEGDLWSALLSNKALRTRGQYLAALPMLPIKRLLIGKTERTWHRPMPTKSCVNRWPLPMRIWRPRSSLPKSKDPIEVVQLQQQYLVRQMQALPSQTLELSRVGQELWVRSASRFPFFRRKIKADHPTW
jgi:hypothetical protein